MLQLYSLWLPILHSSGPTLPGHMQVRLQKTQNWEPRNGPANTGDLLPWLQKLQFKLGQIEVQSSAATQFYTI